MLTVAGRAWVAGLVTALGCALIGLSGSAAAGPPGNTRGELSFGGLQRTYLVHAPAGNDQPAGLVINLHGAGATGQAQEAISNYDSAADALGLVVAYPDGIDQSWADGRGASTPDRQGVDDVGFLVALVDRLVRDYGIPPGRVFATGMSAGGFMANRLACDRADVVAAVAPVAGTLGSGVPCAPSRPVSVLQFHGTADGVVPFGGGGMVGRGGASDILSAPALAARWRAADGCSDAPVEEALPSVGDGTGLRRYTSVGCAGGTSAVFIQIDGGGHTWPSGNFALPDAGPTTGATNASLASAQFFTAHGR
ncbi:PHB depolymerase family esterase [Mycolicibacterium sp. 050158]|uniref:extracellular catalytic domain type 1 short-chain-length polyhydroxyalkanoate depolymerase n=1 Tax=Mycolicibacterium sp. 050158 TaxID=3090602 RepID=UPI00299CE3E5|nr:PHB depolymerase family esterase [Mycolicibacterium sp. 050158]MDX1888837.1 PHB depolymerase family esterase [Mycolicibacterium sp. 050158]